MLVRMEATMSFHRADGMVRKGKEFDCTPSRAAQYEERGMAVRLAEQPAPPETAIGPGNTAADRLMAMLNEHGMESAEQVKAMTDKDLTALPGIGEKTVEIIRREIG